MAPRKKKPIWNKIRTEYETTNISQRKIADKYSVSYNTLKDRAGREGWVKKREEITATIIETTHQKFIDRKSDALCEGLDIELQIANLIIQRSKLALEDDQQFQRHLVQHRKKTVGKEDQFIEEKIFDKIDSKALREITAAFTEAASFKKDLIGVMNTYNQQKIDIEKAKLELEREKLELEKAKLAGPVEEVDVQQYVDALQGTVTDVWSEETDQDDNKEKENNNNN